MQKIVILIDSPYMLSEHDILLALDKSLPGKFTVLGAESLENPEWREWAKEAIRQHDRLEVMQKSIEIERRKFTEHVFGTKKHE